MEVIDWHGCYDESWKGLIVDEAFAHPAKAARGLIRRIFEHMESQGWLEPRSSVLDVFGGIGTTLIQGASIGHACVGVELEERFVKLARENFELHRLAWEKFGDPMPVIIHGDSRKAAKLVRGHFVAVVGSPPFSGTEQPCASQTRAKKDYHAFTRGNGTKRDATMTSDTPGQLGAMKAGDVDAVISSPPYVSGGHHADQTGAWNTNGRGQGQSRDTAGYGVTPSQLGQMKEGDFDACVGSPPYWDTKVGGNDPEVERSRVARKIASGEIDPATAGKYSKHSQDVAPQYGVHPGNLGNRNEETFWSAAREILLQVHQLLRPGGYSAWIVKDYVKDGKRVPFCDNWAKLCEACGFEIVQRARCLLVKETTNPGLFGDVTKKTERKSFFRRLHERKPGAVRIDWEEVIFVRKP